MHEAGFVHRDLKPSNVMWLPRENRWTVIDFGCVARIGEPAPISYSLRYTPPEVVRALTQKARTIVPDPAMDAWALGVMAYEVLTGAPVFNILVEGPQQVRHVIPHAHA
jgi:serine/threonine protein kinase